MPGPPLRLARPAHATLEVPAGGLPSAAVEDCSWPECPFLLPCGPHSCWPAPTITTRFCCRDTSSRKRSDPLSSSRRWLSGGAVPTVLFYQPDVNVTLVQGSALVAKSRRFDASGLRSKVSRRFLRPLQTTENSRAVGLIGLSKTLFSVSEAVTIYTTLLAPVALVLLPHSFQPFFVLGLGIVVFDPIFFLDWAGNRWAAGSCCKRG